MLKLLQYCNYIIIVMQIKLMLLLLLSSVSSTGPSEGDIFDLFSFTAKRDNLKKLRLIDFTFRYQWWQTIKRA